MGKKVGSANGQPPGHDDAPGLVICRNKHWKYISSFHGPWLQLPPEILESLAHQNWTMPPPRLIDPAVFYDVVKIRRAVEEAACDSVRAATGLSRIGVQSQADCFTGRPGPQRAAQLSKERIFRIRQQAASSLAKAYSLDEVAASVAAMQATSTIEDVSGLVLKREPRNVDAKYAHFFHEKVPSRAVENHTPLDPLDDILASVPSEHQVAPLRTRALVQMLKDQWEGAVADLTAALRITHELKQLHRPGTMELELASKARKEQRDWINGHASRDSAPPLKEDEQPTSLEGQLLFHRAGAYLTLACRWVYAALDGLKRCPASQEACDMDDKELRAHALCLEARKRVKNYARRALKDYMSFLSNLDYTPGLPFDVINEIMHKVYESANGVKTDLPPISNKPLVQLNGEHKTSELGADVEACESKALTRRQERTPKASKRNNHGWPTFSDSRVLPVSALFAEKPPVGLPKFPSESQEYTLNQEALHEAFGSREAVTYHPLLTDALHSLLLCHSLLQTSPTELLRHANNVARLIRIVDGYPIFQVARSPARADWIEVIRRGNNWFGLSRPWQKLCSPTPLPTAAGGWTREHFSSPTGAIVTDRFLAERRGETVEQKKDRIRQESIADALADERVVDEESFCAAVRARERRALEDEDITPDQSRGGSISHRSNSSGLSNGAEPETDAPSRRTPNTSKSIPSSGSNAVPNAEHRAQDEHLEYPISTERAEAIVRWVKEAPLTVGTSTKRRRSGRRKKAGSSLSGAASVVGRVVGECENDERDDTPD